MTQSDIMIVDDNPANLRLLEDMLQQRGHEVHSFPLGRLALAAALKSPPDLILLDINMPEMNGYEVCGRLKRAESLSNVPVIFLSALNETQDKVRAFKSGAVDYISKPFQFEEVHARVETHLKLHDLQRVLKLQNERLEAAVSARTHELAEANRRLTILDRSKNEFLTLISHEFRTPLNGLLGVGQLVLEEMPSTVEKSELQAMFDQSSRRILSILDDALLLTQIDVHGEQFRSGPIFLHTVLTRAIVRAAEFAESRHVKILPPRASLDLVLGNDDLLVRALRALIETAIRFSDVDHAIGIAFDATPEVVTVRIESHGTRIPDPALTTFFDVFSIGEDSTPGGDLGLGPAVAYRILSLFGASVKVTNLETSGIRLTVSLTNALPRQE